MVLLRAHWTWAMKLACMARRLRGLWRRRHATMAASTNAGSAQRRALRDDSKAPFLRVLNSGTPPLLILRHLFRRYHTDVISHLNMAHSHPRHIFSPCLFSPSSSSLHSRTQTNQQSNITTNTLYTMPSRHHHDTTTLSIAFNNHNVLLLL